MPDKLSINPLPSGCACPAVGVGPSKYCKAGVNTESLTVLAFLDLASSILLVASWILVSSSFSNGESVSRSAEKFLTM